MRFLSSGTTVLTLEEQEGGGKETTLAALVLQELQGSGRFSLGVQAPLTTTKYTDLAPGIQKGEKRRKKNCEA